MFVLINSSLFNISPLMVNFTEWDLKQKFKQRVTQVERNVSVKVYTRPGSQVAVRNKIGTPFTLDLS